VSEVFVDATEQAAYRRTCNFNLNHVLQDLQCLLLQPARAAMMEFVYTLFVELSLLAYVSRAADVSASCTIEANSGVAPVKGTIHLKQPAEGGQTTIHVYLTGFNSSYPAGTKHGFHVHNNNGIGNSCNDAGPHYNPFNVVHGAPTDSVRHVGDLGNVAVGSDGIVDVTITDNIVSLVGNLSVVNRTIVVHELEDDLGKGNSSVSNSTGNAGKRYGCCIITVTANSASTPTFETLFMQLFALISYYVMA